MTIASVLATFNVHKSKDDTGSEEEVEAAYSDGAIRYLFIIISRQLLTELNSHPNFKCTLSTRSSEAIKVIQESN